MIWRITFADGECVVVAGLADDVLQAARQVRGHGIVRSILPVKLPTR